MRQFIRLVMALILLSLTVTSACGEEEITLHVTGDPGEVIEMEEEIIEVDETLLIQPLPIDQSPGYIPNESLFAEDGYKDASITVRMERITVDDAIFNVARVTIADASQLRTAMSSTMTKSGNVRREDKISTMARKNNAVVAIGGDYFNGVKSGYLIRQGELFRNKPFTKRDLLIIDGNGDFHILILSDKVEREALEASGVPIVNTFNFGPALVVDGELQEIPKDYEFHPNGNEPRCAIGQTGPLSYLLVVVDGRRSNSNGCTQAELAQFMYDQGCIQAYNLDGGNSALMVFHGENYSNKSFAAERAISDIIYFSTAIPDRD